MRAARAGGCALEGYEKAVRYNLFFPLQTSHKMALLPLLLALKALLEQTFQDFLPPFLCVSSAVGCLDLSTQ